jgi:hypothetical protein
MTDSLLHNLLNHYGDGLDEHDGSVIDYNDCVNFSMRKSGIDVIFDWRNATNKGYSGLHIMDIHYPENACGVYIEKIFRIVINMN